MVFGSTAGKHLSMDIIIVSKHNLMSELENVHAGRHKACLEIRPREPQTGTFSSYGVGVMYFGLICLH